MFDREFPGDEEVAGLNEIQKCISQSFDLKDDGFNKLAGLGIIAVIADAVGLMRNLAAGAEDVEDAEDADVWHTCCFLSKLRQLVTAR